MEQLFLPDVVYCDVQQVRDSLGVLVSDLATEYRLRTVESKGSGGSAGIDLEHSVFRVVARYASDRDGAVEKEALVSRPTAALLADLHKLLHKQGRIQRLVGFDRAIWDQLRVGEFVEIDGHVEVVPWARVFEGFLRLGRELEGTGLGVEIQKLRAAAILLPKLPVVLRPYTEDPDLKFVSELKHGNEYLPGGSEALAGDLTLLGRVRKIVREKKREVFGLRLSGGIRVTRERLQDLLVETLKKMPSLGLDLGFDPTVTDLELEGPWVELNTFAIYQLA